MSSSKLLWGLLIASGSTLIACGDDTMPGGAGSGGQAEGGQAQGGQQQGGQAQGGQAQGGQAQGGDAQGGAGEGGAGQGGQGASLIEPTITDATFFADCMPIIGSDPLSGSFTADYDNSGLAAGSLTVTSVALVLSGIDTNLSWSFDVAPMTSGSVPARGSVNGIVHNKVPDSGSGNKGNITPCGYCGASGTLTVDWQDEGAAVTQATFPIEALNCAF